MQWRQGKGNGRANNVKSVVCTQWNRGELKNNDLTWDCGNDEFNYFTGIR